MADHYAAIEGHEPARAVSTAAIANQIPSLVIRLYDVLIGVKEAGKEVFRVCSAGIEEVSSSYCANCRRKRDEQLASLHEGEGTSLVRVGIGKGCGSGPSIYF